jgi:hypothetical protein
MAVFTSFSDESTGQTERDNFIYAGWIGPEDDWARFFTPAWDERVLAGPPRIPYLHMTEIRSREWREANGLTEADAENRIDQACVILDQLSNLQPIRIVVDAGDFRDEFRNTRVVQSTRKQFASSEFEPDYICFLGYTWAALKYLAEHHPEVAKLDFVVERKNKVTNYIQDFHAQLPDALAALESPQLGRLVGELCPGGKDRLPLHAADLLSWHCARREKLETMSRQDKLRYKTIAFNKGIRVVVSKDMIGQMKSAVLPP